MRVMKKRCITIFALFAASVSSVFAGETSASNAAVQTAEGGAQARAEATQPQGQSETAQQQPADSSDGVLAPVEAVGSRFDEAELSRPQNATFLTAEDISDVGAASIPELLLKTTTIRLVNYTGNPDDGQLAMRGFGENSQLRIAVVVDGVRYNRIDMDSIPWLQIPMDNIASVEVMRGANSARYGNNAVAGVINVKTRDISKTDTLAVGGFYGSYDTYSANAFGSISRFDGFATVNARRYYTGGYRDYSESWADNFGGSVGYFLSDTATFAITGNYSKTYTEYPNALTFDDMMRDPQHATSAGTIYSCESYVVSGNFDLDGARTKGFANISFNSRDREISSSGATGFPVLNDQYTFTFASEFETEVAAAWRAYAGFEAQFSNIDRTLRATRYISSSISTEYMKEYTDLDRLSLGVHAGVEHDITERLTADICARFDAAQTSVNNIERAVRVVPIPPYYEIYVVDANSYDQSVWQTGGAATASLNYKFDELSSAYLKFDQLFRYPATDEIALYQGWGTAGDIKFNKDLKPETGQNVELGYKFFGENLNINASVYALFMHDEIMYYQRSTPAGNTVNDNLPDTMRLGADIYASYDVGFGGAYSGASLVDARFIAGEFDGNKIPLVPWFNCFAGVFVRPVDLLTITFQANYTAAQYQASDMTNSLRKMPDYVTFDIRANARVCKYASVFASVENVLDETYATVAVKNSFYPAMGRMFKVGLNLKF